jgi:pimeloyl-ACP methyl ester carboxylesterase
MTEPTSRRFTSQGLDLHYLDWGNEGAPLLFLVHGIRDHARSWDSAARALSADWHVIALDWRGHGDSAWSPDAAYLNIYHLLDLANLIDSLSDEPVTIIGHSYGGNVSHRYAGAFPEKVRKLVLVEGLGPSAKVRAGWAETPPATRIREWADKRRKEDGRSPRGMATLDEAAGRMVAANGRLTPALAHHLALHGTRQTPEGLVWKYDPRVNIFVPEDFNNDSGAVRAAIKAPVLLCYGRESWAGNPEEDGRAQDIPDYRLVMFDGAGHWVHHDRLDEFLEVVRGFI